MSIFRLFVMGEFFMPSELTPKAEAGQTAAPEAVKLASSESPGRLVQKERRAFRRRPFRARVRIQTDALGMGPMIEVTGLNISEGGIAFTSPKAVTVGKPVVIEITRQSVGKQTKWEAEVKWSLPLNEKQFNVGCIWRRRLNFTDIQNFL
jgi:PilZ domain